MLRHGLLITMVAVLLVTITMAGLIGCKSSRKYDDDSMHAAEALTAYHTGAVDIFGGKDNKKIDLAADIFDATTAFDAEHGAFAHVSAEKRDAFKKFLKDYLQAQTDGTEQKNPIYGISEEDWDEVFDTAFPWKENTK